MKIAISQARPPAALPPPLHDAIGNPNIAAVLGPRAAAGAFGISAAGRDPAEMKLQAAFFAAAGLEPKSAKVFPKLLEVVPPENQVLVRLGLNQLETAAQEAVGKPAFGAGLFVLGSPEQIEKMTDGALPATVRLAAGGKLAAEGVKALSPLVPALAPNAAALGDALMLLTAPDALSKALDPDQPAFKRLTAGGRLLVTGLSVAAHFVPALATHAAQFRTVSWLCNIGDKTYAALVEIPKPAGDAMAPKPG